MYDWNDYLKIAYDILKNNSITSADETKFRVAISRSYYAVFHNAKSLCCSRKELKTMLDQGRGEHDKIFNKLSKVNKGDKEFISKCHGIANNFKMMKLERQRADYDANIEITKKNAEVHCRKAERLIIAIDELKK